MTALPAASSRNETLETPRLEIDAAGRLIPWRDLFAQQAALELEMDWLGRRRAERRVEEARKRRSETELGYGQAIVEAELDALADAVETYLGGIDFAAPGRKPDAALKLRSVAPETAALLTLRVLADRASAETPLGRAALEIGALVEDAARFESLREEDRKAAARLASGLSRTARRRARKAMLRRAAEAAGRPWTEWSLREREHVGLRLVDLALAATGAFEATQIRIGEEQSEWRVRATAATREAIASRVAASAALRPVRSPMVAAPRPFEDAKSGGYLTAGARPLPLVKPQTGAPTRAEDAPTPEDAPIVFAAITAAQATPWRINAEILKVMGRALEGGPAAAALPAGDPAPEPGVDAETDAEGARLWRLRAEWSAAEKARRTRRSAVERAVADARRFALFDAIYFPAQYDFRGRLYPAPGFNPQGPDSARALLEFARGKPLGTEGWKWLAIHLCNAGDFEKMSKAPLGERAAWALDNEERLLSCAIDPESDLFWLEADQPWQFLAACVEWAGFRAEGESFVSHLPIALDGACSGLQHFSLALRDEIGGGAVNLAPKEGRAADIYEAVAVRVRTRLEEDANRSGDAEADKAARLARQWRAFGVDRKLCKRPTMTYGYGARGYGYAEQVMSDILGPAYEAHRNGARDWPFDGRGFDAATYMAAALMEAIEATVVKAAEAMRWLQDCAALAAEEGLPLVWRAPDGFVVRQAYRETRARRIRAALGGAPIRLNLRAPSRSLDKRRQRQGVAPNFVHALDGCHLRLTVARAVEEGLGDFSLIHDSFGVHAADTPRFFQLVRETMVEMYDAADVMRDFADALTRRLSEARRGDLEPPPEPGGLALDGVLESEFCFS